MASNLETVHLVLIGPLPYWLASTWWNHLCQLLSNHLQLIFCKTPIIYTSLSSISCVCSSPPPLKKLPRVSCCLELPTASAPALIAPCQGNSPFRAECYFCHPHPSLCSHTFSIVTTRCELLTNSDHSKPPNYPHTPHSYCPKGRGTHPHRSLSLDRETLLTWVPYRSSRVPLLAEGG